MTDFRPHQSPVRNQGDRPTCVAFATSAAHEWAAGECFPLPRRRDVGGAPDRRRPRPRRGVGHLGPDRLHTHGHATEPAWPYEQPRWTTGAPTPPDTPPTAARYRLQALDDAGFDRSPPLSNARPVILTVRVVDPAWRQPGGSSTPTPATRPPPTTPSSPSGPSPTRPDASRSRGGRAGGPRRRLYHAPLPRPLRAARARPGETMTEIADRYISAPDLSHAWLETVRLVAATPDHKAVHVVVRIADPTTEEPAIHNAAQELIDHRNVTSQDRLPDIETTRNTIFPAAWARLTAGPPSSPPTTASATPTRAARVQRERPGHLLRPDRRLSTRDRQTRRSAHRHRPKAEDGARQGLQQELPLRDQHLQRAQGP